MTSPDVSIVLPTFNRLKCLQATVDSVLEQTMTNWELIVSDDGSDGETVAYLKRLEADRRVRVLQLEHSGNPGKARNVGLAAARAPYVAFLDSDDLWVPAKLNRQLAAIRRAGDSRWSYTAFTQIDERGVPLPSEQHRRWTPHKGFIFAEVVQGLASIRTPTVLACTQLVHDTGGFDEAIDCSEDYDLWMRLALASPACVVDEPLVQVRRHPDNRKTEISRPYAARDYSLRKLARCLDGTQRAMVKLERSRNMLGLVTETAVLDSRRRALAILPQSLPLGWRYPSWWFRAAKTVARVLFNN